MSDLQALIGKKQRLASLSMAALLGLPIFLSMSRVFREWAPAMVMPYRVLTPIYVFGLLIVLFKYRKALHEIIFQKLTQDLTGSLLDKDEQITVSEIKNRQKRITTMPWYQRNFWFLASLLAAVAVDFFLWSLAQRIGKPGTLAVIFAVLSAGVASFYYWKHECFAKSEKRILGLFK